MKAIIVLSTLFISLGLASPTSDLNHRTKLERRQRKGIEVLGDLIEGGAKALGHTGDDITKGLKDFNDKDPNPNFFTAPGGGTQIF
ncbi:hypothetical protein CP533_4017 [Ophiocordyceps camponoti-saundersi (nom. inval.)]|nr:hypothetical protein CP533_4017 [Ophiocordyceps camponoti-saundersi (nom. inval.)]